MFEQGFWFTCDVFFLPVCCYFDKDGTEFLNKK